MFLAPAAIVVATIAAAVLSLWLSWVAGVQRGPLAYVLTNLALSFSPALLLRYARARPGFGSMVLLVPGTAFCLLSVFLLHCRYFLAVPPRRLSTLLATFVGGLLWMGGALGIMWLSAPTASVSGRRGVPLVSFAASGVILTTLVGTIVITLVAVVARRPFLVALIGAAVFLLLELLANSLVVLILRRYAAAPGPRLREALEVTAAHFSGAVSLLVLAVDRRVPFVCEVRLTLTGRHVLLLSSESLESLPPDHLRALLAHEWAHVKDRHLLRKILWDTVSVAATCGFVLTCAPFVPSGAVYGVSVVGLVLAVSVVACRFLMLRALTRSYERAADRVAAEIVGAETMIRALTALIADDQVTDLLRAVATHDPRHHRVAAIRQSFHHR